jgi:hypothetical protein
MNGTSAPYRRAISAYSSESVETMTFAKIPLWRAAAIEYAIRGCPARGLMFLCGRRFEPDRAGMKATAVGVASPFGLGIDYTAEGSKVR